MNAVPPSFDTSSGARPASLAQQPASAISLHWEALAEAAKVVGAMAGLAPEPATPEMRNFPALIDHADGWRRERAEHGIADLAAVMEPGIAALLAVNARGADPKPAALALWREFAAAQAAVISLLPAHVVLAQRRPV